MANTNAIGDRGESIFNTRITQGNVFKVYFLGEKAPFVDFLLEILDPNNRYYFLVQVKGTSQGYNRNGYLKAHVENSKLLELTKRDLPTYIAGVDIDNEIVYLCPAFGRTVTFSSIPTTHFLKLSDKATSLQTINLLKQDVITYWQNSNSSTYKSAYQSLLK